MNEVKYEDRVEIYEKAISAYGKLTQVGVCLEEMSELQKELCKMMFRGDGHMYHLAEEIADVTIMLEQLRVMFPGINDTVCEIMDAKVLRLKGKLEKEGW